MLTTKLTTDQYTDLMKVIDYAVENGLKDYVKTVDGNESEAAENHIYTIARGVQQVFNPDPVRYNHAFDIAFSVENNDPNGYATADELIAALEAKLNHFKANPSEIIEACGASFDTYEIE